MKNILFILTSIMLLCANCTNNRKIDFNASLDDARQALTDNDVALAQKIADRLRDVALGPDSNMVGETQVANLSILYMQLSEQHDVQQTLEDENIADATQLFRRAFRLSADSLKSFYNQMPLDDTRHFVLLRRLGVSIDNPMNLNNTLLLDNDQILSMPDSMAAQF